MGQRACVLGGHIPVTLRALGSPGLLREGAPVTLVHFSAAEGAAV